MTDLSAADDSRRPVDAPTTASRASAPTADAPEVATRMFMLVSLGGELVALNVFEVKEILTMPPLVRVPNLPPFMLGVTNLRGEILSVADLRLLVGLPAEVAITRGTTRVVIVEGTQFTLGLVVDAVVDMVTIPEQQLQPIGANQDNQLAPYAYGGFRQGTRYVTLLDVDRLLETPALSQFQ